MEDDCNCSAEHKTTQHPLKNEAQHVMSWHVQADSVMGTVKHPHTTQSPYNQSCSSSNTEKASTQPVQLATTDLHYCCVPVLHSGGNVETLVDQLHSSTAL